MNIDIIARNVYGVEVYYPSCDKAQMFADMVGIKTLTPHVLMYIKRLGYTINVIANKPRLNILS